MPQKNTLRSFRLINAVSMAASITSDAIGIQYLDNVAMQMVWTGSPVGTFSVEGSLDYQSNTPAAGTPPVVVNAGTWTAITLSPTPAAAGSAGNWLLDMTQFSFPWVRLVYTRTSGSGTLNAYVAAKEV